MGVEPVAYVRRSAWGMLYADDAGIVSLSSESLAEMMTVIVIVFEAAGLTLLSEKKTETMLPAHTQPGAPDLTARRRSSGAEVYADDATFVP